MRESSQKWDIRAFRAPFPIKINMHGKSCGQEKKVDNQMIHSVSYSITTICRTLVLLWWKSSFIIWWRWPGLVKRRIRIKAQPVALNATKYFFLGGGGITCCSIHCVSLARDLLNIKKISIWIIQKCLDNQHDCIITLWHKRERTFFQIQVKISIVTSFGLLFAWLAQF